jgi:hypothetical protein
VRNTPIRPSPTASRRLSRFADDEASGAVSVDAPKKVKVRANSDQVLNVKMTINGLNLPGQTL